MPKLLSIIFCFLAVFSTNAQTWEAGGFIGGSGYMGDINPVRPYKISGLAFGGQVKRNFDGYWSAKLNGMHGNIRANDARSSNAYQRQRNINFYSPATELSLQAEFNFFKYLSGAGPGYGTRLATPYLFAGAGVVKFNPKTKFMGDVYELKSILTEQEKIDSKGYRDYALSIPYGAGVKYNFKGNFNLIGEIGYRTAYTDYLDDVSGRYPDFISPRMTGDINTDLSDPSGIATPGTQRGDFRKRDTYLFVGISLTYTFVTFGCYDFN